MAQQIKKKFLSPEVINYFDDQINAVESDISSLQSSKADKSYTDSQDAAKLAEAKAYTDSQISAIPPVDLSSYETIANVDSKDAAKLVEAKAYTDAQIAAIPAVGLSGYYTKTEVDGKESGLQSQIDTEKGRIDAILLAADADKDSFAEIVSLINSVDTSNDTAFAGYVSSNNARVDALEAKGFSKGSQVVGSELSFIDLDRQYLTILSMSIGRLAVHEGEDYTVSIVGGVTRITWIGSLLNPSGSEKIETGDKVFWSGAY